MRWPFRAALAALAALLPAPAPAVAQQPVPAMQAIQAVPAAAFLDTIGVNTHLTSAWDTAYSNCANSGRQGDCAASVDRIAAALRYAGIHHIRDSFSAGYANERLRLLAAQVPGLQADFLTGDDRSGSLERQLAAAAPNAGLIDLIEGPNEPNNAASQFSYRGQRFPGGAQSAMRDLRAALRHGPFAGLPLVNAGLGGGTADDYRQLGNVAEADFANSHAYIGTDAPHDFVGALPSSRSVATGKPTVITETGTCTMTAAPSWCGVTEAVQAKYALAILADAFRLGIRRTYLYELVDEAPDPRQTDVERHFGQFRADWTPKPAATALHNLTTFLQRPGPDCAGALAYDLPDAKSVALRRADGAYVLIAWTEASLWRADERTEIAVASRDAILTLAGPASRVRVSDPMTGVAAQPVAAGAGKWRVAMPDHPVLIEVAASGCETTRK